MKEQSLRKAEVWHMNEKLRADAGRVIDASIRAVLPEEAVRRALSALSPGEGRTVLIAAGKAAWRMAKAAVDVLGCVDDGVVITKYGHVWGELPGVTCYEAGHPVPDEAGFRATERALEAVRALGERDRVLFLLSGGGSALFEQPLIPGRELAELTRRLLESGADIVEMNTVRKRLSGVKGGRFAQICAPARVFSVVLSDILGDPLDMIASGPACPDPSTCAQALAIARRYELPLSDAARKLLSRETPKALSNVETHITGSVRELCAAAARECAALGYEPILLSAQLDCEAREAGRFLASIARTHCGEGVRRAYIAGGETLVHISNPDHGLGGRNQELALAAASGIAGQNACIFSVGSDGTDGPTDAAGGIVDGDSLSELREKGIDLPTALARHDAYHALRAIDSLIVTGPTGTNVNDLSVALLG